MQINTLTCDSRHHTQIDLLNLFKCDFQQPPSNSNTLADRLEKLLVVLLPSLK